MFLTPQSAMTKKDANPVSPQRDPASSWTDAVYPSASTDPSVNECAAFTKAPSSDQVKPRVDVEEAATLAGGQAPQSIDPHYARESQRYAEPIASREAILALLDCCDGPLVAERIAAHFGSIERLEIVKRRLAAMVRDGQLVQNRRGGFAPVAHTDLVAGSVLANPDGFGFLRVDEGGDDVFLPPYEMRKVFHGDRVLVSANGIDRRGRREGVIVRVLEHRTQRVVGYLRDILKIAYVEPDDKRIQHNIQIPTDGVGDAHDGQLVVCAIIVQPTLHRPAIGRICAVLGPKLTPSLCVQAALMSHGLPQTFGHAVMEEVATIPAEVEAGWEQTRVDLRSLPFVTIDGEDAKDFDDAVYCQTQPRGFRLYVAIADVTHYVQPGTVLDEEAQRRATSVYFPGYVVPMLPEALSNGICSLNPRTDRLSLVCQMEIDHNGEVTQSQFYQAVIHSHARLTYQDVWVAMADSEDDALVHSPVYPVRAQVHCLQQLYHALAQARQRRGAIAFESKEMRFELDQRGEVVRAGLSQRNDAHKLIEECMIAANVEAARLLQQAGIAAPYRIHEPPPAAKYDDLLLFLKEFRLSLPRWEDVKPMDFTQLLAQTRERREAGLIESVLLRSQSLASYATEHKGHFGLALADYTHFTSPIRRYPDVLVHRAIKHIIAGHPAQTFSYSKDEMKRLLLQCSEQERRAEEAEREVDERFRAAWMERHIGSEFAGVISGVTAFGLFVELEESNVTGLVHVTQLPRDYYHFDVVRKTLAGERHGQRFRLGDPVRVLVLRASMDERKIDFRLISSAQPSL